jgi:putative methionine-R-sulfoxide reductase with GAF domain
MKALYKNLALLLSLIFTLSIIGLAYYLYVFPERVANETHVISLMDIKELNPVFSELYIFTALSFLLGFSAILLLIFTKNNDSDTNVVYIEKFKESKKDQNDKVKKNDSTIAIETELSEISTAVGKEKDVKKKSELLLSLLSKKLESSQAAIYQAGKSDGKNIISLFASYAFVLPESQTISYEFGEGLAGQVAKEQNLINISDVPEGYISILSGLGEARPAYLVICPIKKEEQLVGVAEMASFKEFTKQDEKLIEQAFSMIADSLKLGSEKNIADKIK